MFCCPFIVKIKSHVFTFLDYIYGSYLSFGEETKSNMSFRTLTLVVASLFTAQALAESHTVTFTNKSV